MGPHSALESRKRRLRMIRGIPKDQASQEVRNRESRIEAVYRLDQDVEPIVVGAGHAKGTRHLNRFQPFQIGEQVPETECKRRPAADFQEQSRASRSAFDIPRNGRSLPDDV